MASSSPLSDPPSSPPRSPSRNSLRKRGSYDPSTLRMARRLKSAERFAFDFSVRPAKTPTQTELPAERGRTTVSSKFRDAFIKKTSTPESTAGQPASTTLPGGKGGGKERANLVASAVFGSTQTKNDRGMIGESGGSIDDDSDESQPTTPTPLAKTMQALHVMQDHTIPHEVDRHWTAFESGEALRKIISQI